MLSSGIQVNNSKFAAAAGLVLIFRTFLFNPFFIIGAIIAITFHVMTIDHNPPRRGYSPEICGYLIRSHTKVDGCKQ
jgi:hypothetical protein